MSQLPRWYREQLLKDKLKLNSPVSNFIDQSDYSARLKAVQETLDQQDQEFQSKQCKLVSRYRNQLKEQS